MSEQNNIGDNIVFMSFADAKVPEFKVDRRGNWVKFGTEGEYVNRYPDYLLYLYNKSAKHNAIINGKVSYIVGNGIEPIGENPQAKAWAQSVNAHGETLDMIVKKIALDIELYGGMRLQLIARKDGRGYNVYHADFGKFRVSPDGKTYYYKNDWNNSRETQITYPAWQPGITGTSIFAYNEYRPGMAEYPLPGYLGANNYIETDIEISKYYLSAITNGMMPSKLIQFFNGNPPDEKKRDIERKWQKKFTGAEKAGKFVLVWNQNKEEEMKIEDLSATELDKQFQELDRTVQQNIFSGHQITSPMLFGVKESGQLGGNEEIKNSYDIFKNTYVNEKQNNIEGIVSILSMICGVPSKWEIKQVDPIGFRFADVGVLKDAVPRPWLMEKLGIDESKYVEPTAQVQTSSNDNLKALSGRENQNLMRIIRQFGQGKITEEQARVLLRGGYALNDEEINTMLGIEVTMSATYTEEAVAGMFEEIGEPRKEYFTLSSKPIAGKFDADIVYFQFAEVTRTKDKRILELIQKDGLVSAATIAEAIAETENYVTNRIAELEAQGLIKTEAGIRKLSKPLSTLADSLPETSIQIRYSYEKKAGVSGNAIIPTSRPFCRKLIELDKLYSRAEIERISERVGYSVFDRAGGFWNNNGDVEPSCRHEWRANVVFKKK